MSNLLKSYLNKINEIISDPCDGLPEELFYFASSITAMANVDLLIKNKENQNIGSKANTKYITFFSIATLLPSVIIAFFSLFLFSFIVEKYLDKKVTSAVNNSYDLAVNYVDEIRNNIEADILLVGLDINRNVNLYYDNPSKFKNLLRTQRLLRRLDEIHLLDGSLQKLAYYY